MNDGTTETTQTTAAWWQRLASGLKRSSSALGGAIAHVVAKRQLIGDAATRLVCEETACPTITGHASSGAWSGGACRMASRTIFFRPLVARSMPRF